ncbi:MAG TPA: M1 family metallopeptidase [Gemmatimonadaceae bacterium]|jgi:hypothetical protein|nr:M1 family metallopeptidase [Gemmatimonadaceae bacterium]
MTHLPNSWTTRWAILGIALGGSACTSVSPIAPATAVLPPVADTSIFAPLTLPPAPSATRLATGAPGPQYWQNRADYDLTATLDTATKTVHGTMALRYTNHSPDTLTVLWIQTEQNRFRDDPAAALGNAAAARTYGDVIEQCTELVEGQPVAVQLEDHKTETKVTLPTPLPPGRTATFHVTWHAVVPAKGTRLHRDGALYLAATWYPRVNVYDDVKGWNIEPYINSEFYLEYGDFTLAVTLPADYIVAATGTLDNPADVLTLTERTRLAQAAHTDTTIPIVTAAELGNGTAHLKQDGMVTWKFHATNVRDAVWAAAPNYQWDATSWHGILAQAYYRPQAAPLWHAVADIERMSLEEYSERWSPYPYPQVSAAEGPLLGDEQPMLSFDAYVGVRDSVELYQIITHETGHNWFPMLVGSNERVHPWMDEGINTFINTFSEARRYPAKGDQTARADHDRALLQKAVRDHHDTRLDVPTDSDSDAYLHAYHGPSGVLQMLRRDVIGPAVFDRGLRLYIQRWADKHPTPQDFYRTMADVAGRNLDWFWREWFYETPNFDQAIDSVTQTRAGQTTQVRVVYGNRGRGVLPLLVRFTFSDSTTREVTYPAEVWRANSTRYTVSYTFSHPVTRIVIDPDHHLVDANHSNNIWTLP